MSRKILQRLKLCTKARDLEQGKILHTVAVDTGAVFDSFVANTLVSMYAKCGAMLDAQDVFNKMQQVNVVSWTALILGYAENGQERVAVELYSRMRCLGYTPDAITFVAVLKACAELAGTEEGKQLEGRRVKLNSLELGMIFHSQAASLLCDSHIFVASTLLNMYAKCGSMADAQAVFERMRIRNVVTWNALILGYVDNGEGNTALKAFSRMRREGYSPDALTFVPALKACGLVGALEFGKTLHKEICNCGFHKDPVLGTGMVDFYAKCGDMLVAQQIFDSLSRKDLVAWTALLAGYSRLGDAERVFQVFREMQDARLQPDRVTLLCVLTSCSHAGLVNQGKQVFATMASTYGLLPGIEHYHCMVDMLGRANELENAVNLAKTMPFKPDIFTWTIVLGACRKWKNVQMGKLAFDCLLKLDGTAAADVAYAYVLMANIYGSKGMWEEQFRIQAMRLDARAWKQPGQSCWSSKAGELHTFMCGDRSHPQYEHLHSKLRELHARMREHGYTADTGSVLHNISDAEKEDALCGHSEKLAIACALINTSPGSRITITKNLRICDDCHRATALISGLEKRTIVCRDANRFHVFEDGKCSCGDYW